MGDPVIQVEDLRRRYKARTGLRRGSARDVEAVQGISFQVERGELFGLLGPNGAGKTTTIKMLITLLLPTGGTARVLGHDVVAEPREVRKRVGYVFGGDQGLYERLSGLDNLRYFAELYAVPAREQAGRIGELLELVRLTAASTERVEGYSRGMRQRLHIARGLLHRPEVLFLDEPSIGHRPGRRPRAARRRSRGWSSRAPRCCSPPTTCSRPTSCATGSRSSPAAASWPQGTPDQLKQRVTAGSVVEVEVFGVGATSGSARSARCPG